MTSSQASARWRPLAGAPTAGAPTAGAPTAGAHMSATAVAFAWTLGVALACTLAACGAPAADTSAAARQQRAGAALAASGPLERGAVVDLDTDPVWLTALGVGNTPEQARARAFENVRVEAARIRSVRISSETTLAESSESLSSSDGFDAAVSSSSLSARSHQQTRALLRGVAPSLVRTRLLPTGAHEARAELSVPREQIVPQRVLTEFSRRGATPEEFEGFRLRAQQREDWDAVAQVETQLLAADPSEQRVLDLALTHERRGRLPMALQILDRALDDEPGSAALRARREALARKLVPVEREIDELLRGLRGPDARARADAEDSLALSVDRDELRFGRLFVMRGRVPATHDLLLFWIDAEQLTAWSHYPAGEWFEQEYAIEDAASWRAGRVRCLALSGPRLAASWNPDLDIDLGACARGNLAERQRLDGALGLLRELAAAPGSSSQVLGWTHLERRP